MSKVKDGNVVIESPEEIRMNDAILLRPEIKDYSETKSAVSSAAGAATFDIEDGNIFTITLSENVTFTFSNPPASGKAGSLTMILTQDGTPRTVTWPGSVKWDSGTEPDVSTAGAIYVLTFITIDAGTAWYGFLSGSEMATP